MPDATLEKIKRLVRSGWWSFGTHVREGLERGEFERRDIENSIESGKIRRVQRDEQKAAIDGNKYVIVGRSHNGLPFETVGKIVSLDEERQYFVCTAYRRK